MTARPRPRRRAPKRDPLIQDLADFIGRFVVMEDEKRLVVALWIVHTHAIDAADQTPYLAVTSPEKRCGKSRLLEVMELLVSKPWPTITPSEAVVFRHVHNKQPTMLLDETDTIFNPRNADRYEGLRAMLNTGNRRGAKVPRAVGTSNTIAEFSVFCPKVLAGIGTLPDTVTDRSIPIRLQRRMRDEDVERFKRREVEPAAQALWERADQWAEANGDALRDARPAMPDELSDREQDGCEIILAIADRTGYGPETREALIGLFGSERLDDQESMRLRLLRDLRDIFNRHNKRNGLTRSLLSELYSIEEAPWSNYYNRGLEARDLATLLRHYGVEPTTVRPGKGEAPAKGYKRDDLEPVWERYL
jgi:hypothetical protein